MATASLNKIERAHQMYRDGRHEEALGFYTEALAMAKSKAQKIALHSNRAACFLKLQDFKKAAEECTSVLELDHKHTGALMLRAQTLVTLREYHSALFDVNRLMEMNPSSEVYQNLHSRLKTQLSLAPIFEDSEEEAAEEEKAEEIKDKEEAAKEEKAEEIKDEEAAAEEKAEEIKDKEKEKPVLAAVRNQEAESTGITPNPEVPTPQTQSMKDTPDLHSKGWEAIPKPKGHSNLDYSRWDRVEDDSSEDEEDDDEESQPQYRFRVKTVGVRPEILLFKKTKSQISMFSTTWKAQANALPNIFYDLNYGGPTMAGTPILELIMV
ncbi:hypothetical protein HHK36_000729 [Tetracentron sinense]|uniref:Uncharacterized protein n=1 Tax=Tetracentron sinense TaxID=13715 RepID=A0A835DU41_TETSI|nr:hypothetical protein HHK36_000729 [Tetracentron sinense]